MSDINRRERETNMVGGKREEEQDAVFPNGKKNKEATEGLDDGNSHVTPNGIRTSVPEEETPPSAIRRRDLPSSSNTTVTNTPTRSIRFEEMLG